jgi:hypothetical protein
MASTSLRPVSTRRGYYRNPPENALTMTLDMARQGAEKG